MTHSTSVCTITGFACVFLAAVLALLGAEIVTYSRNVLLNHPEWVSGKTLQAHGLMGALPGERTRNLLRRNRLNLHEWFGFNELLLNRVFAFGSVKLSFLLDEDAHLSILFNKTATSFCGVRFSRRVGVPSVYFRADSDGKFLEKQPLAGLSVSRGWHTVELRARHGDVQLEVDGQVFGLLPAVPLPEQIVGVRAGRSEVLVDDVVVTNAKGEVVFDEDFRNDRGVWILRSTFFVSALGLSGVFVLWRSKSAERRSFFRFAFGAYVLVLALILYFAFDFFYWSSRYPYTGVVPWTQGNRFSLAERVRQGAFAPFAVFDARFEDGRRVTAAQDLRPLRAKLYRFLEVGQRMRQVRVAVFRSGAGVEPHTELLRERSALQEYLASQPLSSAYTILFLGTSQTQGMGASHTLKTMVSRIHAALAAATERPLASFNASLSGSNAEALSDFYQLHLAALSPDLVVVNLSNNDNAREFTAGLQRIVGISRERGAQVLFVLEANSLEVNTQLLQRKHEIMRRLAAEADIPVVDLFGYIAQHERDDAGFIWWDRVHLTSYGQRLAAESIASGILQHFGEALPTFARRAQTHPESHAKASSTQRTRRIHRLLQQVDVHEALHSRATGKDPVARKTVMPGPWRLCAFARVPGTY